jgi:hypothetical protein
MGAEMEQMHTMLQNVSKSMEAQDMKRKDYEAQIKAYQAETQRIAAVQSGLGEEQIHDIVMGTLHAAMATGDIVAGGQALMPRDQMPEAMSEMPQGQPMPPQQGMPQ